MKKKPDNRFIKSPHFTNVSIQTSGQCSNINQPKAEVVCRNKKNEKRRVLELVLNINKLGYYMCVWIFHHNSGTPVVNSTKLVPHRPSLVELAYPDPPFPPLKEEFWYKLMIIYFF